MMFRTRVSESFRIGPFRIRLSEPLTGGGRSRVSVGTRVGPFWLGTSTSAGRGRRRGRR